MEYSSIKTGRFISRPNRFIANVEIDGEVHVCHVKNTGRCRELLVPGAKLILQHCPSPSRRTGYDLIAVYKGERLINMDSAAPNAVAAQWLSQGGLGFVPDTLRAEYSHGDSRYDFYLEHGGKKALVEVKGVTLERDNAVFFPDAPTLRGVKHLRGLIRAIEDGFEAYALFIVQMSDVSHFEPNADTHPEFAQALRQAREAGVKILAIDCNVAENSISPREAVKIVL